MEKIKLVITMIFPIMLISSYIISPGLPAFSSIDSTQIPVPVEHYFLEDASPVRTEAKQDSPGRDDWSMFSSSNDVNDLFIDGDTLWAGTYGGVIKWDLEKETYIKYTTLDGLVNNVVTAVLKDIQGNMWFGTRNGISVFDGSTWRTIQTRDGLVFNQVTSLAADPQGNIWVGTAGGVSTYDGTSWQKFTKKDGLADIYVTRIFADSRGVVWVITYHGFYYYNGNNWNTFAFKNEYGRDMGRLYIVGEDSQGNIWLGYPGLEYRYVATYDGANVQVVYTRTNRISDEQAVAITEDNNGNVCVVNDNAVIFRVDGGRWTGIQLTEEHIVVTDAVFDSRGNLWFGTLGRGRLNSMYITRGGIYRLHGTDFSRHLVTGDGPVDNNISSIFQDKDGNIWVGTSDCGVSRYDGKTWTTYTPTDGMSNYITREIIGDGDNNIWVSSFDGGVSYYDGKKWHKFNDKNGLDSNMISGIASDYNGDVWIAHSYMASRYDGDGWIKYTVKDGLPGDYGNTLIQDNRGNIWVLNNVFGVGVYTDSGWQKFPGLVGIVNDVFQDSNNSFWFATSGGGVSVFSGNAFRSYTRQDGLAGNNVYAVFQDSHGIYWFGTDIGLSRYDGSTWKTYTTKDGLVYDCITDILQDSKGNLWFITSNGVSSFDGSSWQNFTIENGLADNYVTAVFEDNNGSLWFGTRNGISQYTP